MQPPARFGAAQCVKPALRGAVALIFEDKKRLIEESLLRLRLVHAMLVRALSLVARIPIEADDTRPIDHWCILEAYTDSQAANLRAAAGAVRQWLGSPQSCRRPDARPPQGFVTLPLSHKNHTGENPMAAKTDFTPDQWKLLLQSPLIAGLAVSAAEPSRNSSA